MNRQSLETMPQQSGRDSRPHNKPVHEIRIGLIKVSIWEHTHEKGVIHNATVSRSYRSGDAWHQTERFGRDDLLTLSKLADLAHTWVWKQQMARQQR